MKGTAGNGRNAVQLPLLLTTAIHLGALLLALVAPRLVPEHLRTPEVYQVELYTAPEVQPAQPPCQAPVAAPSITAPPPPPAVPAKNQAQPSIATPAPPRTSPKAVSLAPLKERLVRENRVREEEARRNRQLTERMAQLRLDLQQQQAEKQARETARQAREAIAETYRNAPTHPDQVSGAAPTRSRGDVAATGANLTPAAKWLAAKQLEARAAYVARLREHLRRHWKLPVLQDWDEKLSATMVIKIKRDGSVITSWFEKHSSNSRFDQYVKKAVDRASPLPPLPREFEQKSEEIAVTFTPGGLN